MNVHPQEGETVRSHSRATRVSRYTDVMANLTIAVDDETLKRARIKAIERHESVNRVLAERLREYAGTSNENTRERNRAVADALVAHARAVGKSADGGWTFDRADLYSERLGE